MPTMITEYGLSVLLEARDEREKGSSNQGAENVEVGRKLQGTCLIFKFGRRDMG